jgi:hypothetical protein
VFLLTFARANDVVGISNNNLVLRGAGAIADERAQIRHSRGKAVGHRFPALSTILAVEDEDVLREALSKKLRRRFVRPKASQPDWH